MCRSSFIIDYFSYFVGSEKQTVVDEKTPPMIEKPLDPKPMVQKPQTNPYTDMCRGAPSALLPHPDSCAKHIDCSKVMQGMMGEFECPFPTLWNSETKRCDSPLNVKCGTRWEPKDACKTIRMCFRIPS